MCITLRCWLMLVTALGDDSGGGRISINSKCLRASNDVPIPGQVVMRIDATCPGFNLYRPPNTFVHRVRIDLLKVTIGSHS